MSAFSNMFFGKLSTPDPPLFEKIQETSHWRRYGCKSQQAQLSPSEHKVLGSRNPYSSSSNERPLPRRSTPEMSRRQAETSRRQRVLVDFPKKCTEQANQSKQGTWLGGLSLVSSCKTKSHRKRGKNETGSPSYDTGKTYTQSQKTPGTQRTKKTWR